MNNISLSAGFSVNMSKEELSQIELVSAICGAGKSTALVKEVNLNKYAERYIIACKSDLLCEQFKRQLPSAELINTTGLELRKERVKRSVTQTLSTAIKCYHHRVIICTHKALELIGARLHVDNDLRLAISDYRVIVDEIPSNRKQVSVVRDMGCAHLFPWFEHTIIADDKLYAVNIQGLRAALRGGDSKAEALMIALINGDTIHAEQLPSGEMIFKGNARSDLYHLSKYCKNGLTVMGANAERSPLVVQGLKHGHLNIARPSTTITVDQSRNQVKNTSRVKIGVLMDRPASKRAIRQNINEIAQKAVEQLKAIGKPFIWTCNNADMETDFVQVFDGYFKEIGGVYLKPGSMAGLNDYRDYTVAVHLQVTIYPPTQSKYYADDFEASYNQTWDTQDGAYQFLSRTAIRNLDDSNTECHFLVLDEVMYEHLKELHYPDCERMDFEPVHVERISSDEQHANLCIARVKRSENQKTTTTDKIQTAYDLLKESGMKATQKAVAELAEISLRTVKSYWKEILI